MSPEQALAKRVIVDHRTDIYSLGVTLYELLTLQPAFTGKDRHQLHHQIAFEEPRRLRQLNRALPADLETVILKAIAKNPTEQYATAQELAEDLQRFLDDRPVITRRPRLTQRLVKWSRRHRQVVRLALALLLVAAIAGPIIAIHEASLRKTAMTQTSAAVAARKQERDARLRAERAEKKAAQRDYSQRVTLALRELTDGYRRRFTSLLDSTHAELSRFESWEYRWLTSRRDESIATIQAHEGVALTVAWDRAGKRIATGGAGGSIRNLGEG